MHGLDDNQFPKFTCENCNKSYRTSSSLARHKRSVHYESKTNKDFADCFKGITDFKCNQCEKEFKRKDQLQRHQQSIHDESFQLACPSCERIFKRKDKLTKHMKSDHQSIIQE